MPPKAKTTPRRRTSATRQAAPHAAGASIEEQVALILDGLRRKASKRTLEEMPTRYGVHAAKALGVSMANMKLVAKSATRSHDLAAALWKTGWYEARMVAAMLDEPAEVTPAQMDRWCRDFDNWGICDTVCFVLFDRVPDAFDKVSKWANSSDEFVKRGAFALLACLALHNKQAPDEQFLSRLPLIERAAADDRNFVKKGVSWALRSMGRRNATLRAAAVELAERLARSPDAGASRWVGKDALRDLKKKR